MDKPATIFARSIGGFVLVGLLATLWHYGVLKLLTSGAITLPLALANVIGYCSALMISYTGNRYFVFTGKRGHMDGFTWLAVGYLIALCVHTGIMIGLTGGDLLSAFDSWLAPYGGWLIVDIWTGILSVLPHNLSSLMQGETPLSVSTTLAFLCACFVSSLLTYCWNRFVVFQPKQVSARHTPQESTA